MTHPILEKKMETSAEHTPGPWSQSHRMTADGMYSTQVYDSTGETIATLAWHPVPFDGGTRTDRAENARLIAAAPDLKEAVIELLNGIDGCGDPKEARRLARAALAKSEGRSS